MEIPRNFLWLIQILELFDLYWACFLCLQAKHQSNGHLVRQVGLEPDEAATKPANQLTKLVKPVNQSAKPVSLPVKSSSPKPNKQTAPPKVNLNETKPASATKTDGKKDTVRSIGILFNDNNDNNNHIQRRSLRYFAVSSLRHEPSRTYMYAQVTRAQSCANHVQHIEHMQHVVLGALWYEGTTQLLSLTEVKSHRYI